MVNRNGLPGRTPNTRAPLIRGEAAGFGVRMTAASRGAARIAAGWQTSENVMPANTMPTIRNVLATMSVCMKGSPGGPRRLAVRCVRRREGYSV